MGVQFHLDFGLAIVSHSHEEGLAASVSGSSSPSRAALFSRARVPTHRVTSSISCSSSCAWPSSCCCTQNKMLGSCQLHLHVQDALLLGHLRQSAPELNGRFVHNPTLKSAHSSPCPPPSYFCPECGLSRPPHLLFSGGDLLDRHH